MVDSDITTLVASLRRTGFEPTDVEVKSAGGGLPKSVPETLSAFANGAGGTLILGLSEADGFRPAEGFDPAAIRDALVAACVDKLTPPLRAPVEIEDVDGALVVSVVVEELDPVDKPCFVTARGEYGGSYIRGGDGDRRLSRYEVSQFLSNRTQPAHDREPVLRAVPEDLDDKLIDDFLQGIREGSSRLSTMTRDEMLLQLDILVETEPGVTHPTLAGLLCFGIHPQRYFPQLFVSVVALPGLRMGETDPEGSRFLDNQRLTGPIPAMVESVLHAVMRNMSKAAIIVGIGRRDRYDYPLDVIRELVVNAIMHRDYSPDALGAQIQIEIYPDRMEVRSPGGLHGPITTDVLGTPDQRSTSRNALLATLLSDLDRPGSRGDKLCENRGSGLQAVMKSLQAAGMSPPEFKVAPDAVDVVVPSQYLLAEEVISWIGGLGESGLSDHQHLALAMMRLSGATSNALLQTWGVDRIEAGQALRDLVARGLATESTGRRYAMYRLPSALPSQGSQWALNLQPETLSIRADLTSNPVAAALAAGHHTTSGIERVTGLNRRAVLRRLNTLIGAGDVERVGATTSPHQTYRLTRPEETP